jgi:hypothetical protein
VHYDRRFIREVLAPAAQRDAIRVLVQTYLSTCRDLGVQTWLMHVLRTIDRQRFRMDFLVHTTDPCAYDDEIRALGEVSI